MDLPSNFLPGDPRLIEQIVYELKSQGIFDQFRKECIADVDTKPAYQNLSQRVEGSVMNFLNKKKFASDLNKNQLREQLRKNITESGFLESGVERIVDQVVNPKINTIFLPKVEDVVYRYLGIAKPTTTTNKEEPQEESKADLMPKDLEAVSPESSHGKDQDQSNNNVSEEKTEEKKEEISIETNDYSLNSSNNTKTEEDESPPFEPIEENTNEEKFSPHEESSVDSQVSGFSGLASHDYNHSTDTKVIQIDTSQSITQNSTNSDGNLSVVTSEESTKMEICEDTNMSGSTKHKEERQEKNIAENEDKYCKKDEPDNSEPNIKKSEEKKSESKRSHDRHKSKTDKEKINDRDKRSHSKSSNKSKDKDKSISKFSSKDNDKERKDLTNVEIDNSSKKEENERDKHREKSSHKAKENKEKSDKNREKLDKPKEKSDKDKERSHRDKEKSDKDKEKDKSKSSKEKSEKNKDKKAESDKHKSRDKEKSDKNKSSSRDKHDRDRSSSNRHRDKSSSSSKKDKNEDKSLKDKSSSSGSKSKESSGKNKDKSKSSSSSSKDMSKDKDKDKKGSGDSRSKSSDKYKTNDKDKSSSKKDKDKKVTDDHYSFKDKKNDRRSTDRDSNDGSGKISGNNSFNENFSNSQKNTSKDSEPFTSGSGDSNSNSDTVEQKSAKEETDASSVCVPVTEISPTIKYNKPKYASNIHEAMKIMKIRKQLAKLERQNQLALANLPLIGEIEQQNLSNIQDGKTSKSPPNFTKKLNSFPNSDIFKVNSKRPTAQIEDSPILKSIDLSMESFEALEARLALEMARVNKHMYGDDDDDDNNEHSSINFSPLKKQKTVEECIMVTKNKVLFDSPESPTTLEESGEMVTVNSKSMKIVLDDSIKTDDNEFEFVTKANSDTDYLNNTKECDFNGFVINKEDISRLKSIKLFVSKKTLSLVKEEIITNNSKLDNSKIIKQNGKKLYIKLDNMNVELSPKLLASLQDSNGVKKSFEVNNGFKGSSNTCFSSEINNDNELCYFEKPDLSEARLKILNGIIERLEKSIEEESLKLQNNIPQSKKESFDRGKKRKAPSTENNNSIDCDYKPERKRRLLSDANQNHNDTKVCDVSSQSFNLPLSPTESDKSEKAEPVTVKPKRKSRGAANKRYSSEDLYKPRPILSCTTSRRRGRLDATRS